MDAPQAEVVAAYLPDWSQTATKQDLADLRAEMNTRFAELESRLFLWVVGLFVTFTALLDDWSTVLAVWPGLFA